MTPEPTTTLIQYRGNVVAVVGPQRFHLAPQIESRTPGDPLRSLVTLMCAFARRVNDGTLSGPYTEDRAEQYARSALIDDHEFLKLSAAGAEAPVLADHFGVPVEQIAAKRHDLGLDQTP